MAAYYPSSDQSEQNLITTRRYQIREKIFSFGDNFKIKDENGQPVFTVRSKLLVIGDKLVLQDMDGNPLIKIRQELFNLLPKFKLLSASNDQVLATVKQKFTFLRKKFDIISVYGEFQLDSVDFWARSFKLMKNGRLVATVSKKFSWTDSYGVEISENEDPVFILSLIIVLDQVLYDKN